MSSVLASLISSSVVSVLPPSVVDTSWSESEMVVGGLEMVVGLGGWSEMVVGLGGWSEMVVVGGSGGAGGAMKDTQLNHNTNFTFS